MTLENDKNTFPQCLAFWIIFVASFCQYSFQKKVYTGKGDPDQFQELRHISGWLANRL